MFEILATNEGGGTDAISLNEDVMNKQLVPCSTRGKNRQGTDTLVDNFDCRLNASLNTGQAHSATTPTLHFSSPQVEQIIKETQAAMGMQTNMFKQPLVTLNKSVFEVPTQSMESYGEYGGVSEQLMISTGNNNEIVRSNVKEMAIKSKAPDFIPNTKQQHKGKNNNKDRSIGEAASMQSGQKQHTTTAADVNTNHGHQQFNANTTGQKQSNANTTGQQQYNANITGAVVMVTDIPAISLEDRKLLDALGSPKPHKSAYSSFSKMTGLKLKFSVTNRHEPCSAKTLKRHEPLWMVIQDEANQKLEANLRVASSDEAKEDELIESCPEEAATTRDFSPKNSEKKKVTQEITLRQLPMRAAKQKGVATSTSTRSNR